MGETIFFLLSRNNSPHSPIISPMTPNLGNDLETDSRFPSGEWSGFWLQRPVYPGKQHMDLSLTFALGKVYGSGRDIIGEFTLNGRYDASSGKVTLHKQYLNAHLVLYEGWGEEGKGIWGVWKIDTQKDGFHLWPKNAPPESEAKVAHTAEPAASASA